MKDVYKNVYELSREQIEELKFAYFYQLLETDPEVLEGIDNFLGIPDDVIYEHYEGIGFVDEDFFCTCDDN